MVEGEMEVAWSEVLSRWGEEEAHLHLLDLARDLEALAEVGRRYRGVLEARPEDPMALRFRDEVVKRATAIALSSLPRAAPPRALPPLLRRAALVAVALASLAAALWAFQRIAPALKGGR
ncbi:MAG TPA: hypothetical protein VMG32_14220 [Anaeromyxobacteraceae bacterium]|nr:hypothetical protein [Anaeromyxobacteraceae bacterium]